MQDSDPVFSRLACSLILLAALTCLSVSPAPGQQSIPPQPGTLPRPPEPPILETFQGAPQLSLFPRLGSYRPEQDDDSLPFWRVYREHLVKISGVTTTDSGSGNRAFSFRGIKGIDSVGHFAPLAVQPNGKYRLRLKLKTAGAEGATAGVGILEFKQFSWLDEQYPKSVYDDLFSGSQELLRIERTHGWQEFDLQFSCGPDTGMIHLVFFREGPVSERNPLLIDDISLLPQ